MAGQTIRSGPLTWAQVAEWPPLFWRRHGEWQPVHPRAWGIEGNVSLAAARGAWVAMARRHEALRSSFAMGPAGRPVQRVTHPDDFTAPINCAPVSEYEAFLAAAHQLDPDGPLWSVTIFHEDGIARGSCLLAEHLLYDAVGLRNWHAQIDDLIVDPHRRVDIVHPVDQANAEPSVGHPRVRRARERYGDSLSRTAQVLIPATRQAGAGRYLRSTATFAGLTETVDDIARQCDASPTTVLTYVVGWLIARLARHRSLPVDLLYSNRSAQDQTIVIQVQHVFFSVDFDQEPPAAGIKQLAQTTMGAFAHRRMPRSTAAAVRSSVSVARGVDIREPVLFNVVSGSHARFDIVPGAEWRSAGIPLQNKVAIVMDGDDFDISLTVDAAMITEADAAAVLEDLPKALGHVRDFPDRPLADHDDWSTTPFPLDDGLVRVGPDWVRPHEVAALIAAIPGVRAAEVDVAGDELVATVTRDDDLSYFDIHERLLATVSDHTDVVAPSRYRASSSDRDTWHVRDRPAIPPASDAELALRDAIRRTHGFAADDFGHTYVTAGGDLDLAPAVVVDLTEHGYSGLRSTMFTAPLTLRMIARALTRAR